jgi:hypothetical protein
MENTAVGTQVRREGPVRWLQVFPDVSSMHPVGAPCGRCCGTTPGDVDRSRSARRAKSLRFCGNHVKPLDEKYSALPQFGFTLLISGLALTEGRFAIVTIRRARDAMDAAASGDLHHRTKTPQRTAKSCGPGAATLALRARFRSRTTGARKAASPGRARISRKTIARGKPGCLGCTCQTRVLSFATFSTRRCGRSRRPAFPAPSVRERDNEVAKLRRIAP